MAAGYTLTNEMDMETQHKSKTGLKNRLAMLMAGRVAEQIFMGDICTGASNDIKVATELAERMVTMFGMSDKVGPLYYGKEEEMALRLYNAQNPHSEAIQSTIDAEIKAFITAAQKTASDILNANKAKADIMAQVLLERETIFADDIKLIMEGKTAKAIMAEIDKRNESAKAQEKKDKADAEIEILNRDLEHIKRHSQRFVDAKLASPDKLVKLEENMELAREQVRRGLPLPQLPTLDNLDTYGKMLKDAEEKKDK